ncbi:hypothetical protein KSP40_PGU004914 [Platanthera guangdongensis]|uniref:Uncharacterized protein n=1 Tax=Platanthera guangdongensis TaxID=2320717 RepID=A0ABR2MJL0_9ASPA
MHFLCNTFITCTVFHLKHFFFFCPVHCSCCIEALKFNDIFFYFILCFLNIFQRPLLDLIYLYYVSMVKLKL